jgi:hypothetical protein
MFRGLYRAFSCVNGFCSIEPRGEVLIEVKVKFLFRCQSDRFLLLPNPKRFSKRGKKYTKSEKPAKKIVVVVRISNTKLLMIYVLKINKELNCFFKILNFNFSEIFMIYGFKIEKNILRNMIVRFLPSSVLNQRSNPSTLERQHCSN